MPTAIHTITGLVVDVPQHILESDLGKSIYVEVPEGTKPLVPGMFKPGTAKEFRKDNKIDSNNSDNKSKKDKEVSDVE